MAKYASDKSIGHKVQARVEADRKVAKQARIKARKRAWVVRKREKKT